MKEVNFMEAALAEARKAASKGEVPIGAVVVCGGKIISRAHNIRESKRNALAHAEVIAIHRACRRLKSWRLDDCIMYVTLEPCEMCRGAILNARIKKVVVGAHSQSDLNWKTEYQFQENPVCSEILKTFFADKREK